MKLTNQNVLKYRLKSDNDLLWYLITVRMYHTNKYYISVLCLFKSSNNLELCIKD